MIIVVVGIVAGAPENLLGMTVRGNDVGDGDEGPVRRVFFEALVCSKKLFWNVVRITVWKSCDSMLFPIPHWRNWHRLLLLLLLLSLSMPEIAVAVAPLFAIVAVVVPWMFETDRHFWPVAVYMSNLYVYVRMTCVHACEHVVVYVYATAVVAGLIADW